MRKIICKMEKLRYSLIVCSEEALAFSSSSNSDRGEKSGVKKVSKSDNHWQSYLLYSMVWVLVALALSAAYGFNVFEPWTGALQRISMGVPLIWVVVMAIRVLCLS